MEAQHMTQSNFAALLGLNPATLSQLLAGKANPSLNHVEAIRKGFPNISYEWLIAGMGPMFKVEGQPGRGKEQGLFTEDGESNVVTSIPKIVAQAPKQENTKQPIYEPKPSVYESPGKPIAGLERKVKEIVIYYTDHTFETFVPKA